MRSSGVAELAGAAASQGSWRRLVPSRSALSALCKASQALLSGRSVRRAGGLAPHPAWPAAAAACRAPGGSERLCHCLPRRCSPSDAPLGPSNCRASRPIAEQLLPLALPPRRSTPRRTSIGAARRLIGRSQPPGHPLAAAAPAHSSGGTRWRLQQPGRCCSGRRCWQRACAGCWRRRRGACGAQCRWTPRPTRLAAAC